jgi:hypothetical protein
VPPSASQLPTVTWRDERDDDDRSDLVDVDVGIGGDEGGHNDFLQRTPAGECGGAEARSGEGSQRNSACRGNCSAG